MLNASARADASPIVLNAYTDDYGQFFVDGNLIGSYDNPATAGNIIATVDLEPGWHDVAFTYRNRAGTNRLGLSWKLPGDAEFLIIPESNLRSLDSTGALVSGLRGDYYNLGGPYQFTRFGEGPILHGANSFSEEIYEGSIGLWAGLYGPSDLFEEELVGEFYVPPPPAVPEPTSLGLLVLGGAELLRRRWSARGGAEGRREIKPVAAQVGRAGSESRRTARP
jgi:hypothetical protein